jgi:hypothetical protein
MVWRYIGMEPNDRERIKVRAYGGEVLNGRLIEVRGQTAIVTTDEELAIAKKEKREPICIGFPLSDVLDRELE